LNNPSIKDLAKHLVRLRAKSAALQKALTSADLGLAAGLDGHLRAAEGVLKEHETLSPQEELISMLSRFDRAFESMSTQLRIEGASLTEGDAWRDFARSVMKWAEHKGYPTDTNTWAAAYERHTRFVVFFYELQLLMPSSYRRSNGSLPALAKALQSCGK